jgi:hypothetical protein
MRVVLRWCKDHCRLMHTLKIEHPVSDFQAWRAAFDRDPVGRERSGVRGYRVFRPIDDPRYVIIDLDFAELDEVHAFVAALRALWEGVDAAPGLLREGGAAPVKPKTRIVDQVEDKRYDAGASRDG